MFSLSYEFGSKANRIILVSLFKVKKVIYYKDSMLFLTFYKLNFSEKDL